MGVSSDGFCRSPDTKHNLVESKVMPAKISLIGRTHEKLKVIADAGYAMSGNQKVRLVLCKCECGKETTIRRSDFRKNKSCGCTRKEANDRTFLKHGHARKEFKSKTWMIWCSMIARCSNPNNKQWADYGGRGITVCERWRKFENFLADIGECPDGLSIERRENNGNYEPSNCYWATRAEQNRNKRSNKVHTVNGVTGCLTDLAAHFGISLQTISSRINRNKWSIEKAFNTPVP